MLLLSLNHELVTPFHKSARQLKFLRAFFYYSIRTSSCAIAMLLIVVVVLLISVALAAPIEVSDISAEPDCLFLLDRSFTQKRQLLFLVTFNQASSLQFLHYNVSHSISI